MLLLFSDLFGIGNPSALSKRKLILATMKHRDFLATEMCKVKEVQDLIHSEEKFDLLILETVIMQEIFSALTHKFSAPAVEVIINSYLYTLEDKAHLTWVMN